MDRVTKAMNRVVDDLFEDHRLDAFGHEAARRLLLSIAWNDGNDSTSKREPEEPASMPDYPKRIENGAGEQITFLGLVQGESGLRLELENRVSPGSGPPMHVHHLQREVLTVHQGRMGYEQPGEVPAFAEAGQQVGFEAGVPHRFWNAGDEDLVCSGYIEPADNVEYFLTQIYDSQRRAGGLRPDPFESAYLTRRYANEFGMLEVPAPVQRFVFPILVGLGRLLGKFDRYADAPEVVRRAG